MILAFQRQDQETSSEHAGPSPPNHERACTEDTCFDSTNVCPSSSSPVKFVKGSHDTCHQDRQLANNSSSSDSCNHSIPGGFVCDPASSKSDTRVFTDDASDVTKEAARSSTKNARRKRKKKKKSSTSSNALVPEVCQSNCYINSCEDGSFSIVEEIAANAGSNTALSRTSSSILGTLFITGDNALDGSSPLLGKNEGINLDLSPTAECSPSLEKEEGTASLDNVTNPNSQSISAGDNAGDLHKKMSDTCDSLCSKVLQDLTDVKISRQEGRSSDISLPASKRKNRKGKKLQRSLQQAATLDKEVHLHNPISGCEEHVSPGLVGGKEIQSLIRDTCDISVGPEEGSYNELHTSNVKAEYLHIVPQCYLVSNMSKKITISKTCVNRMFDVVRETYMYQIESEAVHLAIGGSLAAFEDFLQEATPVVGLLRSCQHCVTCEGKKMIGNSLCMHKIPNTPLRKFWRWYDKVGSYGIEVKVEGVQSGKRIGSKVESYSAYFAPLLSAVQLFGHSKYRACTNINRVLKRGSRSSGIPFPQYTKDHNLSSTSSASAFNYSAGPELLFEFFEVEPPHQRPPIHNK